MELKQDGALGDAGQHIFFQHLVFRLLFFLAPNLLYHCLPLLPFPLPSSALPRLSLSFLLTSAWSLSFFPVHSQRVTPFSFPLLLPHDSVPYLSSYFWNTSSA